MHTLDNFLDIRNNGINPFTLSTRHEMCSLESFSLREWLTWSCFVYIRPPLWRYRACITMYSPRKAVLTWSWWYRFNFCTLLLQKLHGFDCYDLNDRGRMEIVGSDGRPHSCVVARPTTAPDTKTWSIPTTTQGVRVASLVCWCWACQSSWPVSHESHCRIRPMCPPNVSLQGNQSYMEWNI